MITYGNGEVLFEGFSQGFEMKYRGGIKIMRHCADGLYVSANKTKIIGVMLNGKNLPQELFSYIGELKILSCKTAQNGVLERERIVVQGVDYWELDGQKWEDDEALWGTADGTYVVGAKQRFNKHNIVVNNDLITQYEGQFKYKDGTPVPANKLIHIHADGVAMTGGVHTEDSVQIYPIKTKKESLRMAGRINRASQSSISGGGY